MLSFRDPYQQQVLKNAKAFALALHNCELGVEGDSERGYTETHQVILNVGKGRGPEIADRLEQANIITNSQGLPYDASFSDASGIRLGVQEMTRWGMKETDFSYLAEIMANVILGRDEIPSLASSVADYRTNFTEQQYVFRGDKIDKMTQACMTAIAGK